jgi:hypothetical protein
VHSVNGVHDFLLFNPRYRLQIHPLKLGGDIMKKSSFGVRIEDELLDKLSEIIDESRYLNITRSEIIETVLETQLNGDYSKERIQDLIIRRREGRRDR